MVDTTELLEQRAKQYGCAKAQHTGAECLGEIYDMYIEDNGHDDFKKADMFTMRMLFLKMVRLGGNPNHEDNYDDINGYVELMRRRHIDAKGN